jgi:hypothetical protein
MFVIATSRLVGSVRGSSDARPQARRTTQAWEPAGVARPGFRTPTQERLVRPSSAATAITSWICRAQVNLLELVDQEERAWRSRRVEAGGRLGRFSRARVCAEAFHDLRGRALATISSAAAPVHDVPTTRA